MKIFRNICSRITAVKFHPLFEQVLWVSWYNILIVMLVVGVYLLVCSRLYECKPLDYIFGFIFYLSYGVLFAILITSANILLTLFLNFTRVCPYIIYSKIMIIVESAIFSCIDFFSVISSGNLFGELAKSVAITCVLFILLRIVFQKQWMAWNNKMTGIIQGIEIEKRYTFPKAVDFILIILFPAVIIFLLYLWYP